MDEELKPVLERQMEVYAGFLEHTDHHVGRVIDAIEELGVLEDTLIYYIIGDNGASAEGTLKGAFNEMANFNGWHAIETPEFMEERIDKLGHPEAYNHYAVGWAWAMDTPYQWTKQVASHWGGTRNGTIVHWPAGITARARPVAVLPCHRRRPDGARGRWDPRAVLRQRRPAVPDEGTSMAIRFDAPRRPSGTTCSTSRWSATAGSTTRAGARSPAPHAVAAGPGQAGGVRRRRVGAL